MGHSARGQRGAVQLHCAALLSFSLRFRQLRTQKTASRSARPLCFYTARQGIIEEHMDKIATLREILEQDPQNALARYGLAMEFAGKGDSDTALSEFDRLLADHPDYTAGYFMSAQTLARAGRQAEAKQRLIDGTACARRTGNQHALREMQAMLDELEMPE